VNAPAPLAPVFSPGEGENVVPWKVMPPLLAAIPAARRLDLVGRTDLLTAAAALKRAALFIGNDTGVMHMATALNVPVVAVFGPTTRHFGFFPFRSAAAVLENDLPCRPCSFHGTERCPETHFNCMRMVRAEDAISAAERLLKTE
jgi:heptosyltransferase-2